MARTICDLGSNWASNKIQEWKEKQLVIGYGDGTFKPSKPISIKELISLAERTLLYLTSEGIDVSYINLDNCLEAIYAERQALNINSSISREEMAVFVAKLLTLDLNYNSEALLKYDDLNQINYIYIRYVNAVVSNELLIGNNLTFYPKALLTRAEAVEVLDRIIKYFENNSVLSQAKIYCLPDFTGNLTITTCGSIIRDSKIDGTLILDIPFTKSKVILDNVTINGSLIINSCSEISIIKGDIRNIVIDSDSMTRIFAYSKSKIKDVLIKSGCILNQEPDSECSFTNISTDPGMLQRQKVILSGNINSVSLNSRSVSFQLLSGSLNLLTVSDPTGETSLYLSENSEIVNMIISSGASITGKGRIQRVDINSSGVWFEQQPIG